MDIDPKVEPWLIALLDGVQNSNHSAEVVATAAYASGKLVKAGTGLLSRADFWNSVINAHIATPGEFDDLSDALDLARGVNAMTAKIQAEFRKCLCDISFTRAGYDVREMPPAQKAREAASGADAMTRLREIWAENPDLQDDLRMVFMLTGPLMEMREIEGVS